MPDSFDRSAFAWIPPQLWNYYDRLLVRADQESHQLVQAIQKQGAEQTWQGINELFRLACTATGLSPSQLHEELGLGKNDFDSGNFQAMLGIIRAINMLTQHGFTQPLPLQPLSSRKEADFVAVHDGRRYAVEVFRSSEEVYRYAAPDNLTSAFATYLQRRLEDKLPQVDATMQAHSCGAGIVVVVMDSYPSKALNNAKEYHQAVRVAVEQVGASKEIHLFLFTGMADEHGNDEFACYPPLP